MNYSFEDFSLDIDRRELRTAGQLVAIEPQVFDLLAYLIRNRDRVVTKDDLLAEVWGGRIVSESTLSSSINAVRNCIEDCGEHQRLIRTVPRKGFRFVGDVFERAPVMAPTAARSADAESRSALLLPDKPSIAVLAFENMSEDASQDYFVDGFVEDITTALSHFRWLFVVARGSSFTYKGRSVDVKQVGRELGVRYVLEGSVRKAGSRVRLTAQLIDAASGAHLWADRFDGTLEDIFDLQDQVTASVVGAIGPRLEQAEMDRAKRKPTESLVAYDYYLRGIASSLLYTKEGTSEAQRLFYKAIELDPDFAAAYGMAAWCFVHRKTHGWMENRPREIAETARLCRQAVERGSEDAVALSWGGFALAYVVHEVDDGAAYLERALVLNPNLAMAWGSSGWLQIYLGNPENALERLERSLRLNPLDPLSFRVQAGFGYAHFFSTQYEEAADWAGKALRMRPNYLTAVRGAAASHALAGRLNEAQKFMTQMRGLDPVLRIVNLNELLPLRRQEHFDRWREGLRLAGLPE